jgi:hypothetical protein
MTDSKTTDSKTTDSKTTDNKAADNKAKTPKSAIKKLSKGYRRFVRRQKQAARKLGAPRA